MFGPIIRGVILLIGGAFLTITLSMAGGRLIGAWESVAPAGSSNVAAAQSMIFWFPAVVILAVAAIAIGSAIARRGRVR